MLRKFGGLYPVNFMKMVRLGWDQLEILMRKVLETRGLWPVHYKLIDLDWDTKQTSWTNCACISYYLMLVKHRADIVKIKFFILINSVVWPANILCTRALARFSWNSWSWFNLLHSPVHCTHKLKLVIAMKKFALKIYEEDRLIREQSSIYNYPFSWCYINTHSVR